MVVSGSIPRYVVDASFILANFFPDEQSETALSYFNQFKHSIIEFISSPLLPFEVINGLLNAIKRKRIDEEEAAAFLKAFTDLGILYEPIDQTTAFQLARDKKLTIYDASYLSLALKYKVPLLTFDKHLKPFSQSL